MKIQPALTRAIRLALWPHVIPIWHHIRIRQLAINYGFEPNDEKLYAMENLVYKNPSIKSEKHFLRCLTWIFTRPQGYFATTNRLQCKLDQFPADVDIS